MFDRNSPDWTHSFLVITLNIRNGRYSNLNMALRTMYQMRVDFGILTETKITTTCTRGIAAAIQFLLLMPRANSKVEWLYFIEQRIHGGALKAKWPMGQMSCRCVLVSGEHRWNLLGAYIPPSETDGETMNYVQRQFGIMVLDILIFC